MEEKACKCQKIPVSLFAIIILSYIFIFPRLIVAWLGTGSPWSCYLYQYGLGIVVFAVGIHLILRTKSLVFGRGRDTYWFKWLIGGFVFFATAHALWILLALYIPVKGGM